MPKKRGWIQAAAGVALSVAVLSCHGAPPQSIGMDFGAKKGRLASIKLESREVDTGQKIWSGTGFFTQGHLLALTNNHVASESALHPERSRLVAIFPDGSEARATVVMADAALDLAALSIDRQPEARLELRAEPPSLGESIAGAGYGLGLEFSISEGRVAAISRPFAASPRIQLSASTDGGVSGGPTLDAQGRAIGVNVAGAGRGVALSIPAPIAKSFLEKAERALRSGGSWKDKSSGAVRLEYVSQVGEAGLSALSAAMDHGTAPAKLGPWSIWAPSGGGDWSCHDLSASAKKAPEPWESRAQGFACAMGAAPMSIGREDAGNGWGYTVSWLDARSEGTWLAWAGWISAALSDRIESRGAGTAVCKTRPFRYGKGLGRVQVCSEAVKELPGLYSGTISAWVDEPGGDGALMARLDYDGLSPEGARKAAAWIQSQVASAPEPARGAKPPAAPGKKMEPKGELSAKEKK